MTLEKQSERGDVAGWGDGRGATGQGCRRPSEAGEGEDTDLPLEALEMRPA